MLVAQYVGLRSALAPRGLRHGRGRLLPALAAACAALAPAPACSQSNNVRITKLNDVSFGALANLGADASAAQSICVFAQTSGRRYRVTATGSAPGGCGRTPGSSGRPTR